MYSSHFLLCWSILIKILPVLLLGSCLHCFSQSVWIWVVQSTVIETFVKFIGIIHFCKPWIRGVHVYELSSLSQGEGGGKKEEEWMVAVLHLAKTAVRREAAVKDHLS